MKCELCGKEISNREANSGYPLVEGKVCDDCNWKVVRERLRLCKEKERSAKEEVATIGCDGPICTKDPMADFEKYAKQFEETFVLGNTPVRKEVAENKTKISNGEIVGEIKSLDKEEKAEQIDPEKPATEALYGYDELAEFTKLCKEIGIETLADLRLFLRENPGDTLQELRKYREELGEDFKIKEAVGE